MIFYGEQPLADILKAVASLPPHTAIFYQQLAVDGAGAVYGDKEPLKRIYEVANAPIFSFDQSYFIGETVGGPMFSPAEGAQPMAAVAVRMLGGEKASGIRSNRLLSTEIRLATTSAMEHQREPPATGERNLVSGANSVGAVFVADRDPSSPFFSYKPGLSRSCYMNIVGVNLPKCSRGSAWRNLPMSTASRRLAN